MDETYRAQIKANLVLRETEELVAIFQGHNTDEYELETFNIINEILIERLGNIPEISVEYVLPRIFERIETLLEKMDYELGLHECESAVRMAPDNAESYNYRGVLYEYLGQSEKAMVDYQHALRLNPNFTDARENLDGLQKDITNRVMARVSELSQYPSTDKSLDSYIRQNFESMETNELVSIWKTQETDVWTDEAFIVLKEVLIGRLGSIPDILFIPPLYKLIDNIQALRGKEDYSGALVECERAVEMAPESPKAHFLLGLTLEDLGEWEKAVAAYSKALSLDPELADALDGLKYAESKLDERVKYSPALTHLRIAMDYAEDEDFDLAQKEIEQAKSILPELASAYTAYGEALMAVRHPDEAYDAFEKAIQLNPDYSRARTGLRNAKMMQDELPLNINNPIDPADVVEVEKQAAAFDEKAFEKLQGTLEETPGWVYMNKDALLVRGSSGHRNRPGRSGLDPLDSQMDNSRFEGSLIRQLLTGHMRTKDPLYLLGMVIVGLIFCIPTVYIVGTITSTSLSKYLPIICLLSPTAIPGPALLINAGLSLISEEPDEIRRDGGKFF